MPNSVVMVGLVVAWLVVLVPMLATHRQQIRRPSPVAMSTRVLYRGDRRPPSRRAGGTYHRERVRFTEEDWMDTEDDVDARSGAYRLGGPADHQRVQSMHRTGRGGYNPEADVMARHARFALRRRVVSGLLVAVVLTFLLAIIVGGAAWWLHVLADVALVGYLTFLRRQTRIEEQVRLRRMARINRARAGVAQVEVPMQRSAVPPRRLRRPGAVVLEIDDDDPSFAELRGREEEMDLPAASGQ